MRRGWLLGAALVLLGVGLWLAFRDTPATPARSASAVARVSSASTITRLPSLFQAAPVASRGEALPIRGLVRGQKGPVAGAVVLASAPVAGESLSELTCLEYGESRPLLDCTSGREREQLLSLVARREGETPVLARAVTAQDGTFALEGLDAGSYALWVESAEGSGLKHDVAAGSEGVELLLGAGVRLSGTVTDDVKRPIAGALVTAIFKAQSRFFEAVSDDRGHFRLGPLPPGEYTLLIAKEGQDTWSGNFTGYVPEVEETFIIQRPKRLSGRVLRAGTPVTGAEVSARVYPFEPGTAAVVTTTDAEGRFSLEGLRPQGHDLVALHGGDGASKSIYFEEKEHELTEITLELLPAAYVEGRALNDEQRPVQGAMVQVRWGEKRGIFNSTSTETDEEGRYRLGPLTHGPGYMSVYAKGHGVISDQKVALRAAEHTVDFTLVRVASVEGILVDAAGQPVTKEYLSLRPFEAGEDEPSVVNGTSGADGRFSLGAPRPGRYRLELRGPRMKKKVLEVLAPSSQRLIADPLPSVAVEVVDEGGMPLPNVSLGLWPATAVEDVEARVGWGYTDLRGRSVVAAPEAGRYQLVAELARDDFIRTASEWVELGETPARVRLRFEGGQELSGIVVDSRGQPIPDVSIRLASPLEVQTDGCGSPARGVHSGPDGRFVFRQLVGERFILTIWKENHELSSPLGEDGRLQVTPGMKDLRLVLDQKPEG